MKKILLTVGAALLMTACGDNREKVVQSQRGDTKVDQEVPVRTNTEAGPETDVDDMDPTKNTAGTVGVTNDTTGTTTPGALNDPTGTPAAGSPAARKPASSPNRPTNKPRN